jgi:Domain of unknown function (DUF6089)
MKRTFLIVLLFCIIVPFSEAQLWKLKRVELVAGLGTATFFGDIGGYSHGENAWGFKDITFLQTRYSFNFSVKYRFTQNINGRFSLSYGILHATDERGSNPTRGYEATTAILEPALIGEYYFIRNSAENSYLFNKGRGRGLGGILRSLDVYAFTGIAGLKYSIEPNQTLQEHGLTSKGFTGAVPLGVGSTFATSPDITLGLELGFRYALSDNIDGYTSQYSRANDVYYFFQFTFTYRLKIKKGIFPYHR